MHVTLHVSLAVGAVAAATSLNSCSVTEVVLSAPVCWIMKLVVEMALTWFASQCQSVVAAGMVIVQPPEVGAVPVRMLNDPVPFAAEMLAAEPPQPAAAIVGAVAMINGLGLSGNEMLAIPGSGMFICRFPPIVAGVKLIVLFAAFPR